MCKHPIGSGRARGHHPATPVQAEEQAGMPAMTDEAMIASAMAAAPPVKVGAGATVVAMGRTADAHPARGQQWLHRDMPDPGHAGPDPMCMDAAAMAWAHAWDQPRDTAQGARLASCTCSGAAPIASNTDPYATQLHHQQQLVADRTHDDRRGR